MAADFYHCYSHFLPATPISTTLRPATSPSSLHPSTTPHRTAGCSYLSSFLDTHPPPTIPYPPSTIHHPPLDTEQQAVLSFSFPRHPPTTTQYQTAGLFTFSTLRQPHQQSLDISRALASTTHLTNEDGNRFLTMSGTFRVLMCDLHSRNLLGNQVHIDQNTIVNVGINPLLPGKPLCCIWTNLADVV